MKWLFWRFSKFLTALQKEVSIFSKVEDLAFVAFLKMKFTIDISSEFCKTFWTTIFREVLLLKCFAGNHYFYYMIGFTFLQELLGH